MTSAPAGAPMLVALDDETRALVALAAVLAVGDESAVRGALASVAERVPHRWVEELILQTYLFAGFPRALNAMREWRRYAPAAIAPPDDRVAETVRDDGEATCARVYGEMYRRLRVNIRSLHPALDDWMVVEGYGKVLARPGLDLPRRELCIVAACAAAGQDRQLHSHLHGAVNAGASADAVNDAIGALAPLLTADRLASVRLLWARVRGK